MKIYDQNGLLGEVTAKPTALELLAGGETAGRRAPLPRDGHRQGGQHQFCVRRLCPDPDYTAPDASKLAITEVYDDVNTAGVIASGGKPTTTVR